MARSITEKYQRSNVMFRLTIAEAIELGAIWTFREDQFGTDFEVLIFGLMRTLRQTFKVLMWADRKYKEKADAKLSLSHSSGSCPLVWLRLSSTSNRQFPSKLFKTVRATSPSQDIACWVLATHVSRPSLCIKVLNFWLMYITCVSCDRPSFFVSRIG